MGEGADIVPWFEGSFGRSMLILAVWNQRTVYIEERTLFVLGYDYEEGGPTAECTVPWRGS